MSTRTPTILSVQAEAPTTLLVEFSGGHWRRYDIAPLLTDPAFEPLRDAGFFKAVQIESGGYALVWNSEIDLAEHEIWSKGMPVESPDSVLLLAAEAMQD